MNKPYDHTKDTSFEVPSCVCKSGLALISTENVSFFRQGICDLANHYGVKKLHYERHIDGGGPPVSDMGACLPYEVELRPGDELRFVTVFYGEVVRRYVVIYINKKEYEEEFNMIDKFVYNLF